MKSSWELHQGRKTDQIKSRIDARVYVKRAAAQATHHRIPRSRTYLRPLHILWSVDRWSCSTSGGRTLQERTHSRRCTRLQGSKGHVRRFERFARKKSGGALTFSTSCCFRPAQRHEQQLVKQFMGNFEAMMQIRRLRSKGKMIFRFFERADAKNLPLRCLLHCATLPHTRCKLQMLAHLEDTRPIFGYVHGCFVEAV